jgi:hypothetical protein
LLGLSFLPLSTIFQLEHQSSLPVTFWGWLCSIYRYLCRVLKIMVCFCLFFCWSLYYLSFSDLLLLITTANENAVVLSTITVVDWQWRLW